MNAADGSIRSRVATYSAGGEYRSLNAVLDNRGLLQVDETLSWQQNGTQSTSSGTIVVTGGNLIIAGAGLTNTASGTIDIQVDGIFGSSGSDYPVFVNQGLFRKSGGNGTTNLHVQLNNSGTVEVQSGTLAIGSFIQTAGTTRLSGGAIVAPLLNIQGGSLTGAGQIFGPVNAAGQVSPGFSPGVIQINGNYSQVASGALVIELAGGTPGNLPNEHDQLDVHGTVALAGALQCEPHQWIRSGAEPDVRDRQQRWHRRRVRHIQRRAGRRGR